MNSYEVENLRDFNLQHIFECGQCFRWNKISDSKFEGVALGKSVSMETFETGTGKVTLRITPCTKEDFENIWYNYLDLGRDYGEIKKKLSENDEILMKAAEYGCGIRILNQDLWETIISFIISQNNNIPRIKGIIDRLSEKYGEKLEYDGSEYYSFPEPIALKDVSVSEYRSLGLGFRDIRLYETTQKILNNEFDLNGQWNLDTGTVYKNLLELSGVGPKVADCILLFSDLKRFDVFPIDVWIRRVMNDLYIHNDDETKVSKVQIQKLADEKFGSLKGLAQQYLFYWRRSL